MNDLTIVVPCHNSGVVIGPLLHSLLNQEIYNYTVDLLFVLDSDNDNTAKLIHSYFYNQQFSYRVQLIPECSASAARNYGIENSNSEYIWFMDSDDWLLDNLAIFKALSVAKKGQFDVLMFDYGYPSFFIHEDKHVVVWQYLFKASFLEDIRFPEQKYDEDVIFMNLVAKKLHTVLSNEISVPHLKEKLYYYNYCRYGSVMEDRIRKLASSK